MIGRENRMVGREKRPAAGQTAEELREELLRDEEFARQWRENEPRRRLSRTLVSIRKAANLSQQELAKRASWNQAHVARMESATGPWPNPESVRKYAEACQMSAGYVFGHTTGEGVHIDGAAFFGGSHSDDMLERIVDADVEVSS